MTTSLQLATVAGPRVRSVPDYDYTSGNDAIEVAATAGLFLDEWQKQAVRDILAEDQKGNWATFETALVLPRQNGKNAVLEAIELAGLFIFRENLIIHTAHLFPTAVEAFRRIRFLIENNPDFDSKVSKVRTGKGDEAIELKSGQRLRFMARSGSSGRGFSADRLIYDEAYELPEETVAASLPTMSARPNPQLVYTSSAALANSKSAVLRRVMQRGRLEPEVNGGPTPEADPNLCYIEYSADPKADLDDREAWALANPGVASGRIQIDFIAKERSAMSEVAFARERLGILDDSKSATVIDMDVWAEREDVLSSPLDPVAFAIDVNPDSTMASIAVAGRRADGLLHAEVVDSRRGTGWVIARIQELVEKWHPSAVSLDGGSPAAALLPGFYENNVDITLMSMAEYGQACQGLKTMVEEDRMRHKGQSGLTGALAAARKRPLGESGAWGWHRRDTTDITPLVAVTLATYAYARNTVVEEVDSRMIVFR